jgi:hypothetical protein
VSKKLKLDPHADKIDAYLAKKINKRAIAKLLDVDGTSDDFVSGTTEEILEATCDSARKRDSRRQGLCKLRLQLMALLTVDVCSAQLRSEVFSTHRQDGSSLLQKPVWLQFVGLTRKALDRGLPLVLRLSEGLGPTADELAC